MTTTTKTTATKKQKKPADRYIFEGEGDKKKIVGAVYFHAKGNGMNILVNGKRYSAFAPKAKAAPVPAGQPATEGNGGMSRKRSSSFFEGVQHMYKSIAYSRNDGDNDLIATINNSGHHLTDDEFSELNDLVVGFIAERTGIANLESVVSGVHYSSRSSKLSKLAFWMKIEKSPPTELHKCVTLVRLDHSCHISLGRF